MVFQIIRPSSSSSPPMVFLLILFIWLLLGFAVVVVSLLLVVGGGKGYNSDTITIDEGLIPIKIPLKGPGHLPIVAYCIFGWELGDGKRMLRLLKSIYHPRNQYLLHLHSSNYYEKIELLFAVESQKEFRAFRNVHVVRKTNAVNLIQNQMAGASSLAAVLHSAALLLRINADWDWFTLLSSSDYPILTQDDILYALSSLPTRHLNFVRFNNGTRDHNKEIVVDPSLYTKQDKKKKIPIFSGEQSREKADAFNTYTGSPWMVLSRSFMEHCVKGGLDNLPRKLLMYSANLAFPLHSYFHTLLCNTPEFQNTIVANIDLRYILFRSNGTTSSSDHLLSAACYDQLVSIPAAFARPFEQDDPLLDQIDRDILNRSPAGLVPGKWCTQGEGGRGGEDSTSYCSIWDDIDSVKPGKNGILFSQVIANATKTSHQYCHTFKVL